MARLMIVTATREARDRIAELLPNALVAPNGPEYVGKLNEFRAAENAVLVGTKSVLTQGFSVPADTIIVVTDGLDGPDKIQAFARAREARRFREENEVDRE